MEPLRLMLRLCFDLTDLKDSGWLSSMDSLISFDERLRNNGVKSELSEGDMTECLWFIWFCLTG